MAPKAKKSQHRHVPSTSYLTDDAAFDSEPATAPPIHAPPPPTRTNDELNLSVLQRHYPAVTSVLSIANFAHLYNFSSVTQQWEQINSQGPLFVCELEPTVEAEERYAVILLNRMELKNFFLELTSPNMVEVSGVYLMLTDELDGVTCLHIVAEEGTSTATQRDVNFSVIQDLAARAEQSRAVVRQQGALSSEAAATGHGNLLHLVSQQTQNGRGYAQQHQGMYQAPLQQQQQQQQQWPAQQQFQQHPPAFMGNHPLSPGGGDVLGSLFARAKASQGYESSM